MPFENNPKLTRRLTMVLLPTLLLATLLLTGAGCTAPMQDDETAAGDAAPAAQASVGPASDAATVRDARTLPRQAPPMSDPLPAVRAPERDAQRSQRTAPAPAEVAAGAPVKIDTRCTRDADCVVKNVGNCCGYYPACVNVASPTDPAAVQAQCARDGTMSVCGFPSISACQCVAGECQADGAAVEQ